MTELLKKDVRLLVGLVNDQVNIKFAGLKKTKEEELGVAQKEIESLYDLRGKLKRITSEAPEETPAE